MKNTAKRSAASKKAWRSRKRMKVARGYYVHNGEVKKEPTAMMGGFGWQPPKEPRKPTYIERALPNPWMQ